MPIKTDSYVLGDVLIWGATARILGELLGRLDPKQGGRMSKFRFHLSVSADGYVAGPDQSEENPLGVGGEQLHEWVIPLAAWRKPHGKEGGEVNASTSVVEELQRNVGAGVMGRNMFGPIGGGDWGDESWKGWWGEILPSSTRSSCSPITSASPSRWREGRPSASSPTESSRHWSRPGKPPAARTFSSTEAPASPSSTCPPG